MRTRALDLALVTAVLLACGGTGSAPAPKTAADCTPDYCMTSNGLLLCGALCSRSPEPATTTTLEIADAGSPSAAADASLPAAPLPPPKPTTLALKTGDARVDAELALGDAAFEKGDFSGAQKHYEAARVLAPKKGAPQVGLARVRIAKTGASLDFGAAKGNPEIKAAIVDLKKVVTSEPDLGVAHAELGAGLLMLGDADQALASLRRAAELLPQEPEAHSMLGVALFATGQRDLATPELQKAADLDMGRAERHGNLGTVYLALGRVPDAVREFELQARILDGDARAHSDLGTALLAQNDAVRATTELLKATQLDPTRASYHSNLGYAYQRVGKLQEAIAEYKEALRLDDKLSSAWINLGTALAHDPKTRGEARAAFEKARALDPTDPNVKPNVDELDALERESATPPKNAKP